MSNVYKDISYLAAVHDNVFKDMAKKIDNLDNVLYINGGMLSMCRTNADVPNDESYERRQHNEKLASRIHNSVLGMGNVLGKDKVKHYLTVAGYGDNITPSAIYGMTQTEKAKFITNNLRKLVNKIVTTTDEVYDYIYIDKCYLHTLHVTSILMLNVLNRLTTICNNGIKGIVLVNTARLDAGDDKVVAFKGNPRVYDTLPGGSTVYGNKTLIFLDKEMTELYKKSTTDKLNLSVYSCSGHGYKDGSVVYKTKHDTYIDIDKLLNSAEYDHRLNEVTLADRTYGVIIVLHTGDKTQITFKFSIDTYLNGSLPEASLLTYELVASCLVPST